MSAEQQFWSGLQLGGMTVYDVGAFHGLLTMFFASRAKTVVCFEPNTQNRKRLLENLKLNGIGNVQVRNTGVGSRRETLKMVSSPLMPGFSSVNGKTVEELLHAGVKTVAEDISIVTLDEEISEAGLPPPDLIKIDIEGLGDRSFARSASTLTQHKPALFLEMHGETSRKEAQSGGNCRAPVGP